MICNNCGKEVLKGLSLCPFCDTKITSQKIDSKLEFELKRATVAAEKLGKQYPGISKLDLARVLIGNQAKACFFGDESTVQNYDRAAILFGYLYEEYQDNYAAYYIARMYAEGLHYNQDINKAIEYYNEALVINTPYESENKENILALLKLGKIYLDFYKALDHDKDKHQLSGVAHILYACEIGEFPMDYAIEWAKISDFELRHLLYKWEVTLENAKKGDSMSIFQIITTYAFLPPTIFPGATMKWVEKGASLGDRLCEYSYCYVLYQIDKTSYLADPDKYETYSFTDSVLDIINMIYSADVIEPLSKEILVVHSSSDIEKLFSKLVDYFHKYKDQQASKEFSSLLLKIVNEASSFHRPKPGLPGFN